MNIVIIEDEAPAAEKLIGYLAKYDKTFVVQTVLTSVSDSVNWFRKNSDINLIFMDVQLTDGLCFEIFKLAEIKAPVIFTTAFDKFALDAFKSNGIDYLLKPVSFDLFFDSMQKFKNLRNQLNHNIETPDYLKVQNDFNQVNTNYKTRFMVKAGEKLRTITDTQIALFYAESRDVFLVGNDKRKYIVDYTLEDLETMLNPKLFFRVNRTFMVNINFIHEMIVFSVTRLKIKLNFDFETEIIVSREKVKIVKEWFDGNS